MRVIICGLGQVGYRVAILAVEIGLSVVVVTLDGRNEWRRQLESIGVRFLIADVRDEQALLDAGLESADCVIACTSNDLTNIEVALDAKRLKPAVRTVARVFDQNLATRLEGNFGIDRALAMSVLAAPAFVAAAFGDEVAAEFAWDEDLFAVVRVTAHAEHELVGHSVGKIRGHHGIATLLHANADGNISVHPDEETLIEPGDTIKLVGDQNSLMRLAAVGSKFRPNDSILSAKKRNEFHPFAFIKGAWGNASAELKGLFTGLITLILLSTIVFQFGMHLRFLDAFYFVVSTVTTTGYGDITVKDSPDSLKLFACMVMILGSASVAVVYSIVTDYIVSSRIQQLTGRQDLPDRGHVIVAGLGDVGYRICTELRKMGVQIVGIDQDVSGKRVELLKQQITVVRGDARDAESLTKANIESAAAVIAATDDDAVNLSIGLVAREMSTDARIVLRLFDDRFARKVQSTVAFDAAMSASRIAAPSFVGAALHDGALVSFVLRSQHFTLVTRTLQTLGDGVPIYAKAPSGEIRSVRDRDELGENDRILAVMHLELGPR